MDLRYTIQSIKTGLEPYGIRELKRDLRAAIFQRDKKFLDIDINLKSKIYLIVCFFASRSETDEEMKDMLKRNLQLEISDRRIMAMIKNAKSNYGDFTRILWSLSLKKADECDIICRDPRLWTECWSNWVRMEIMS